MAIRYIHVPNPSVVDEARAAEWFNAAEFIVHLDQITSTMATDAELELAYVPDDVILTGISWECRSPWLNDSGEPFFPRVYMGDTSNLTLFGELNQLHLGSSGQHGFIPLAYYSSGGFTFAVDIGDDPITYTDASTAGTLDLWLHYRPRVGKDGPLMGVRAR